MTDWENYESGPFCPHWTTPSECSEVCKCGHLCSQHCFFDGDCEIEDCPCTKFTDPPLTET